MGDSPQRTTRTAETGGRTSPQLTKADALRRLSRLKKGTTVAAVLGFGVLSGAIALQPRGTATKATATASASRAAPSAQAAPAAKKVARSATPSATATAQKGFFSQGQGGTNVGSASSAQTPVAGSGTS